MNKKSTVLFSSVDYFKRIGHLRLSFFLCLLPIFMNAQTPFQHGEEFFEQEKFNQAKLLFEAHLKQNPKHKQTLEYLGDIAVHNQRWDDALIFYEALVNQEKSSANYHYKYGAALGMKAMSVNKLRASTYLGDIKRELEWAANLDPKHIETRWALVEYYLQLPGMLGGSEKKSMEYAKELLAISPVDGYLARGHIAEHSKRYKDAEQFYIKATEVGGSPLTYEKLINVYEKDNQLQKALKTATEALKKHQRNSFNYQIGKISAESKLQSEFGIERLGHYVNNYSKKDPWPKAWAYYRLAQVYRNIGEKQTALGWIDKALKDLPDFKEAQKEKTLILAL